MKYLRQLLLAKLEPLASYGVDSVPTAAANWLAVQDIDANPVEMSTDDQKVVSGKYGQDEKIVGGIWSTISFDMPLRGGGTPLGTAATAPNFDVIMRACGMARTVTAGTSVAYTPIESDEESATVYFYQDKVLNKMVGVRGSWELKFNSQKQALLGFKGMGLRVPMTDETLPSPTIPTLPRPVAMNKANTALTFGALAARLSSFTINQGNDVQYRNLTNREDIVIVDRNSTGQVSIEMPTVAEKDFLGASGIISTAATDALTITHGTVPGNIVEVAIPKAQILKPKNANEQGQVMLGCELHIIRNDITLTFK